MSIRRRYRTWPHLGLRFVAISGLLCIGTSATAQVELRLQIQRQNPRVLIQDQDPRLWIHESDSFSSLGRLDPAYTREALQNIEIDADVTAAVDVLGSDDYAQREAATAQLIKDEQRRMQMCALLARESLNAEQRCRLLQIVRYQLLHAPRGAMGVQMEQLPMFGAGVGAGGPGLEIRITSLIANFPAERVLQVGDRIIAIDGQPLIMPDELRERVQSKRPGEMVSVTVKRPKLDENGKFVKDERNEQVADVMAFEFPLGSAEALDRQARNTPNPPTRLEMNRRSLAEGLTYTYATQPEMIRIKGGTAQLAHEDEIDQHPAIVNLRDQQASRSERRSAQDQDLREGWQRTLTGLLQLANKPGLSEQERTHMRRVAERYMQLMNAGS